jgi:hypothetical protein
MPRRGCQRTKSKSRHQNGFKGQSVCGGEFIAIHARQITPDIRVARLSALGSELKDNGVALRGEDFDDNDEASGQGQNQP